MWPGRGCCQAASLISTLVSFIVRCTFCTVEALTLHVFAMLGFEGSEMFSACSIESPFSIQIAISRSRISSFLTTSGYRLRKPLLSQNRSSTQFTVKAPLKAPFKAPCKGGGAAISSGATENPPRRSLGGHPCGHWTAEKEWVGLGLGQGAFAPSTPTP